MHSNWRPFNQETETAKNKETKFFFVFNLFYVSRREAGRKFSIYWVLDLAFWKMYGPQ